MWLLYAQEGFFNCYLLDKLIYKNVLDFLDMQHVYYIFNLGSKYYSLILFLIPLLQYLGKRNYCLYPPQIIPFCFKLREISILIFSPHLKFWIRFRIRILPFVTVRCFGLMFTLSFGSGPTFPPGSPT